MKVKKEKIKKKRPRPDPGKHRYNLPPKEERLKKLKHNEDAITQMILKARDARPAPCEWIEKENHILPNIVNNVYAVNFASPCLKSSLDLIRIAQHVPNTKYRLPNFPSITLRLRPTTGTLFMACNLELIKTTSRGMALYYSHLYRQLIEKIPMILIDVDADGNRVGEPYVGTLEGCLGCSMGQMLNVVGNGVLPQDGVHLMDLLHSDKSNTDYDPGSFPNLIYRGRLEDGSKFCANIANTGKVVLMGLKSKEGVYESYKIVCDVVHNFEDPNVPSDPHKRWKYRLNQLQSDHRFAKEEDDPEAARMTRYSGATGDDGNAGMDDEGSGDEEEELKVLESILQFNSGSSKGGKTQAKGASLLQSQQHEEDGDDNNGEEEEEELPLLYAAALRGQVENVRVLLSQGPDVAVPYPNDPDNTLLIKTLDELDVDTKTREHTQIVHILMERMSK